MKHIRGALITATTTALLRRERADFPVVSSSQLPVQAPNDQRVHLGSWAGDGYEITCAALQRRAYPGASYFWAFTVQVPSPNRVSGYLGPGVLSTK